MARPHVRPLFRRARRLMSRSRADRDNAAPASTPSDRGSKLRDSGPKLRSRLCRMIWTGDGSLQIAGWAYVPKSDLRHDNSTLSVWAVAEDGTRIDAVVVRGTNAEVDAVAEDAKHDYAEAWFTATFASSQWRRVSAPGDFGTHRLSVRIRLDQDQQSSIGAFRERDAGGSAGRSDSYGFDDGLFVKPVWRPGQGGLTLAVAQRAMTATVTPRADGLRVEVSCHSSAEPARIRLARGRNDGGTDLQLRREDDHFVALISPTDLATAWPDDSSRYLFVVEEGGSLRYLHWQRVQVGAEYAVPGVDHGLLQARPAGIWRLQRRPDAVARVDTVEFDSDHDRLRLAGSLSGAPDVGKLRMRGDFDSRIGRWRSEQDGRFSAEIDLIAADRWGNRGLAPLSGGYHLELDGSRAMPAALHATAQLGVEVDQHYQGRRVSFRVQRGEHEALVLIFTPSLTDNERSKRGQLKLWNTYRACAEPLQDTIMFQAYAGKFATCNPLAIMQRVVDLDLPYRCYWGVLDHAVPVPDPATAVLINSEEYWRIRATSRLLVMNNWVGSRFEKRPGQQVVQTFHGTPFKRLGADRAALKAPSEGATRRESHKWDYVVAQSDYMAERIETSYGSDAQVLRTGYPRDDILLLPEGERIRRELRRSLGVRDDQRCLLYAPTWREDRHQMINELDIDRLTEALGDEWVVLVRAHGGLLREDRDHSTGRAIDVTGYPIAEHIFLTSDVAITDYSSIMFDYTVAGKPLLFFVPDLDEYASVLRGVYFDLAEISPGPLLTTTDEVIEALRVLDQVQDRFQDRYRAWQQRFNPWDDGHAADRVVDAVLGRAAS